MSKAQTPKAKDMRPRITVIGVGGAGGNAVNNMISAGLQGVDFMVANTDAQALIASKAPSRIQLGVHLTEGLGAGSKPEIGEAAAIEAEEELRERIAGSHMLFIAAGMGGGTGTGAAAVIGKVARELGVLTIAVVTKPFHFEGTRRMRTAEAGIVELKKFVDTLIVIPNQNLFRVANERTTFAEAFVMADQVLYSGVACIVDLIVKDGLINLDLADVRTILAGMGHAVMGTGEAEGDRRAALAAEEAITNQLLDNMSLRGAKGLLLSIIGGSSLTLFDIDEAASRVREEIDPDANIIVGAAFDESLGDRVRVSIVASGMPDVSQPAQVSTARPPRSASQDPAPASAPALPPPATAEEVIETHTPPANKPGPPPLPQAAQAVAYAPPAAPLAKPADSDVWYSPEQVEVSVATASSRPPSTDTAASFGTAAGHPPAESVYQQPGGGFVPQPPVDVKKSVSRVPEVSDFPAIGQKDYWAKKAPATTPVAAPPPAPVAPPVTVKKGSLFQRLADAARGKNRLQEPTAQPTEADQLPAFFGNERRRG